MWTIFMLGGGGTYGEGLEARNQLIQALGSARLPLSKWAANDSRILESRDSAELASGVREVQHQDTVSTLGLRWKPQEDVFSFQIPSLRSDENVTKRSILSDTAKLYDPIGYLVPVIVRAKLIIQDLWIHGSDWDTVAPASIRKSWFDLRAELPELEEISIPRWYRTSSQPIWELHCFADASERAYAAALYIVVYSGAEISSKLLAAKSKVAPTQVISLPKLELCGAILASKLAAEILQQLAVAPSRIHCWSDSKVVLAWLQGHPSRWKVFIANRVSEIHSLLPGVDWSHVRSADNPADCATRGYTVQQLKESELWWHGPPWLQRDPSEWPREVAEEHVTSLEARHSTGVLTHLVAQDRNANDDWYLRTSSYSKLVRIAAYIYRWKGNAALPPAQRRKTWLSALELAQGRTALLRSVQLDSYAAEFEQLHRKGQVTQSSSLVRLLPFIDGAGLLRVGGRLQNSSLSEAERHPIVLPNSHHVTRLIIAEAHRTTLHGGPQVVQSQLSRTYWIMQGRNAIRSIVRKCPTCTRHNARTQVQLMGSLPADRSRPSRPFSVTGVDYAGPFLIKASPGRGHKAYKGYVAIFVCFAVKAVHIEIVSDYTSMTFLAAFKRFAVRRGLPSVVWSDNGPTFQGASPELQRLFQATSAFSQEVAAAVAADGVDWRFIPPRAPHFGGLWEANVRSFKRHFYRVVGETKLTFEEFSTLASQVEACMNSRPISPLSSNAEDLAALTPGHFLIGSALVTPPEPFLKINEPNTVGSRWHLLSLMRNHFWKRWQEEYLRQLQQRQKWQLPRRSLEVGDLVLLQDDQFPATKWPMGRVTLLHPGKDGISRVVTVKTSTSEFRRAITRLVRLPVDGGTVPHHQKPQLVTVGGTAAPSTSHED